MRIAAITLDGAAGWPALELHTITRGLNAVYGPPRSGKSIVAELLAQTLFGKRPLPLAVESQGVAPPGEAIIESDKGRYRVRRYRDADGGIRLTVAALNGSPVDQRTIAKLVAGLSPAVLSPLCAVSFREPPSIDRLLSVEFARDWQSIDGHSAVLTRRRTAELAARRDLLAQELETRIAGERRASKELEVRSRELDRLIRDEQQPARDIEVRLRAVETALAETDARLRYRRLELNVGLHWRQTKEPCVWELPSQELDQQIARWRAVLAELAQREAAVRAQLAQHEAVRAASAAEATDHRAWLAVARQLAADLAGEVARLARASASEQCVCRDAHPRLRPIAETIDRQLDRFETLVDEQHRAIDAAKLQREVENLSRSQSELRRHLDHLLERRQACSADRRRDDATGAETSFSSADAEQLEARRLELEQERFELVQRLRNHSETLHKLRAERDTVGRERAAVLSARSIEHVQRELATVQQKLEQAAAFSSEPSGTAILADASSLASDFLAQLTDGGLAQLALEEDGRGISAVNRNGETKCVAALTAAERDQVYLSICLARLSIASLKGIWLPLVLDEPFERLDPRGTAALAAVLDDFSRQGHQVLVFTGQRAAAERLASLGAAAHDLLSLRRANATAAATHSAAKKPPRPKRRKAEYGKRNSDRSQQPLNGKTSDADRSDAA